MKHVLEELQLYETNFTNKLKYYGTMQDILWYTTVDSTMIVLAIRLQLYP